MEIFFSHTDDRFGVKAGLLSKGGNLNVKRGKSDSVQLHLTSVSHPNKKDGLVWRNLREVIIGIRWSSWTNSGEVKGQSVQIMELEWWWWRRMKEYWGKGKAVSESEAVGGFKRKNPERGGDKGDTVKEEIAFLSHWIHTEEPPLLPLNTNLNFCPLYAEVHSSSPARRWTTESWVYLTDQKPEASTVQNNTELDLLHCCSLSLHMCNM